MSAGLGWMDWSIIGPAWLAGLLVLATHVPLGMQVLSRGIVFIDLAIAQIAGVGVLAADALGWEPQGWAVQVAALGAALAGAVLLTFTEKRWPQIQEALIGVLFVLASCVGLLLVAGHPHGGEHLKELLAGQILWVTVAQLKMMAALTALVLVLWFATRRHRHGLGFYALFALSVTASVQLVGVYLVFCSLIIPALATLKWREASPARWRWMLAYGLGAIAYLVGLLVSARLDLPSGAVIVLAMAALGLLCASLPGQSRPARSLTRG